MMGINGNFEITSKEAIFALSMAILGFIFSLRNYILFLNNLDPIMGLVVYYVIMYSLITVMSYFGLIRIGDISIQNPVQILGSTIVLFAFFSAISVSSPYVNLIVHGNINNVSQVYFQTEDGALWQFWSGYSQNPDILRILTYVVSPFVIALIGSLLVTRIHI